MSGQERRQVAWMRNKLRAAKNLAFIHGPARRFRRFEASFHPETWARHEELLAWAEERVGFENLRDPNAAGSSEDAIVRQGFELKRQLLPRFEKLFKDDEQIRILLHVPPATVSSAHASLGANFIQAFRFLGIAAKPLSWHEDTRGVLREFRPTVLLTVDHAGYLSQIDWEAVREYRRNEQLLIGFNAALQEYGNTPLSQRLDWARRHEIDFYYSHKNPQYVEQRYGEIFERGYSIFYLEFGANPLVYYAFPSLDRDLNYVFLGSTNPDKWSRYYAYFGRILRKHSGYIDGPWWQSISRFGDAHTHRYLCARAKVALNLHIPNQIKWPSELNERTYNLAACGVPQLVDEPKLLASKFSADCFFVAPTPEAYRENFERILNDPTEAQRRALKAQREVLTKHTIFHGAESFVSQLVQSSLFRKLNNSRAAAT